MIKPEIMVSPKNHSITLLGEKNSAEAFRFISKFSCSKHAGEARNQRGRAKYFIVTEHSQKTCSLKLDSNKAKKPTHAQITTIRSITYMMQNCWVQNAFPIYVCLGFSQWNNTYLASSIFNDTENKKHWQY